MQWAHFPPRKKRIRTFCSLRLSKDQVVPVVSDLENGAAGKGDQTSGPRVVKSIRSMVVSSVAVAAWLGGSRLGKVRVLSDFQRSRITSRRRMKGRSRSVHRAKGWSFR